MGGKNAKKHKRNKTMRKNRKQRGTHRKKKRQRTYRKPERERKRGKQTHTHTLNRISKHQYTARAASHPPPPL